MILVQERAIGAVSIIQTFYKGYSIGGVNSTDVDRHSSI